MSGVCQAGGERGRGARPHVGITLASPRKRRLGGHMGPCHMDSWRQHLGSWRGRRAALGTTTHGAKQLKDRRAVLARGDEAKSGVVRVRKDGLGCAGAAACPGHGVFDHVKPAGLHCDSYCLAPRTVREAALKHAHDDGLHARVRPSMIRVLGCLVSGASILVNALADHLLRILRALVDVEQLRGLQGQMQRLGVGLQVVKNLRAH